VNPPIVSSVIEAIISLDAEKIVEPTTGAEEALIDEATAFQSSGRTGVSRFSRESLNNSFM
jgi:hypothetical protein